MPQLIQLEEEGPRTGTVVSNLKGLDLSRNAQMIEKEFSRKAENLIFTEDGLETDNGIKQYQGPVDGVPRRIWEHELISGSIEYLLITNTSLYRQVTSQWVPVNDGNSTTMDAGASATDVLIPVAATAGFSATDLVGVLQDSGAYHMSTVASVSAGVSITLDVGLVSDAASGNAVVNAYELAGSDANPVVAVSVPFADDIAFTNGIDKVQRYDTGAVSCAAVANLPSGGDTICVALAVFDNSLVLLGTTEGGTSYPRRARWCEPGDITDWTGTNAGYEDLLDYTHPLLAGLPIGPYLAVYRSKSITRCVAENSADKRFRFHTVITGEGISSANSVADLGQEHLFIGNRNIYLYEGGFDIKPVGDKISKALLDVNGLLNQAYKDRMFLVYDPRFFKLYVFYTDTDGDYPNKALIYNRVVDEWTQRDFSKKFAGWGITSDTSILTWNDLVGTWLEQEWRYGVAPAVTSRPVIILCSATENETFEYSSNTSDDDGTSITATLETGDFGAPNMQSRFDYIEVAGSGGSLAVWYSKDRGNNFSLLDTIAFSADEDRKRFYNNGVGQFIFKTIRFRFVCSTFFRFNEYTIASSIEDEVI